MPIYEIVIPRLAFIIQARLGSTRLPQKMILPFYNGLSIFEILITKIQESFPNIPIILATSLNNENDVLEKIALLKGCQVFRGEEQNVLNRFCEATKTNKIDKIIRVCADNPFLDVKELKRLIDYSANKKADYISFNIAGVPSIKTHFGFWAEYVSLEALQKVQRSTKHPFFREHVTNYIYENSSEFEIAFITPHPKIQEQKDIRMTIDTKKDFELLSEVFAILYTRFKLNFGIDEIIEFLNENRTYQKEMLLEITNNTK
jgi:spore coat polysaccharide biosynthesis protein SpsF (cytidylyltransferase family)